MHVAVNDRRYGGVRGTAGREVRTAESRPYKRVVRGSAGRGTRPLRAGLMPDA